MAKFSFEVCQLGQVDELTRYIDNYWSKGHILTTSRELLDWQHLNTKSSCYNFVMVRDNETREICGVLGYIPTSHFSHSLASEKEVWLAIWKVNEGRKYVGLGLGLLNYLKKEFAIEKICSIGISQIVIPMYKTLGFKVGQLQQIALINPSLECFKIAKIPKETIATCRDDVTGFRVAYIDQKDLEAELANSNLFVHNTRKNIEYFLQRYVNHPKFKYQFVAIFFGDKIVALMVVRVVKHQGSCAIRAIDIQGDLSSVSCVAKSLQNLLVDLKAEYLDIMQFGMNVKELMASGFLLVEEGNSELIIPDYFQPFVQKNIPIFFARHSIEEEASFVLFKGDADQDRPNSM